MPKEGVNSHNNTDDCLKNLGAPVNVRERNLSRIICTPKGPTSSSSFFGKPSASKAPIILLSSPSPIALTPLEWAHSPPGKCAGNCRTSLYGFASSGPTTFPLASRRCGPCCSPRANPKAGQGVLPSARWNGRSLETAKPLPGAGDTWRAALPSLRDVAYGNGHYVALGEPGAILVSTDGREPESRAVDPGGGPPKDPD